MIRHGLTAGLLLLGISGIVMADGDMPITVAASTVGNFRQGGSWYLSVNSAGQAELTISPGLVIPKQIRRQFALSDEQLTEFRKLLNEVAFFELDEEYGQLVPDGSTDTLTVVQGDRVKSVKVHFLMNWVNAGDRAKLREPARAVRLLTLVRGWFDDPEAVDQREYDQRVLEVLK